MDGLALLCNLFADGPVTLQRLRGARLATLGDLERVPSERLASCLCASVPQARAFADEARKLARRLAEPGTEERTAVVRPAPRAAARAKTAGAPLAETPAAATPLRPGLLPGLDEAVLARLQRHHVRTVQALGEFAGLELARRSGIPYSKLLELARHARRYATTPLLTARVRVGLGAVSREEPPPSGPFV